MFKSFREVDWAEERYINGLKWTNVLSFGFLALSAFLIYGDFIGHQSMYVASIKYITSFTPAHFAFGAMNVVLLLQLIFTVYQALPHDTEKVPYMVRLNFFLPIAWLMEAASLYTMAYDIVWLSFIFSTVATVMLMIAYFRLTTLPLQLAHVLAARIDGRDKAVATFYYLMFYAPTSINLAYSVSGWSLNLLMILREFGFNVPPFAGIVCSVGITVLSFVMLGFKGDTLFALASTWLLFAVGWRWHNVTSIAITNYVCAAVLAVFSLGLFIRSIQKTPNLLEKENIETYRTRTSYQTGIHVPSDTSRLVST